MAFHLMRTWNGMFGGANRTISLGYSDGALHHASAADVQTMIDNHYATMMAAVGAVPPQVNQWNNHSWRVNVAQAPPANAQWFEFQWVTMMPNNYRIEVYHVEFPVAKYRGEEKASLYARAAQVLAQPTAK